MNTTPPVIDVDAGSFQRLVLEASRHTAVLVDFWAAWCGPCKALTPVLEKLARESSGTFVLAKVDTDANRELAMAQGIRSLPTVRLFVDGKPVAEFMGAHPEASVRAFLDQHLPPADGGPVADVAAALDAGRVDEAQAALDALPRETRDGVTGRALAARLAFLREAGSAPGEPELRARLDADPGDLEARFALSMRLAAMGRYGEAMDGLLLVVSHSRAFRDDGARRGILQVFDALGPDDPLVARYRGLLASALN